MPRACHQLTASGRLIAVHTLDLPENLVGKTDAIDPSRQRRCALSSPRADNPLRGTQHCNKMSAAWESQPNRKG
jgi:hypothetical protein